MNEPHTDTRARLLSTCPGCGGNKEIGLVVCWDCFGYSEDCLKHAGLTLLVWLDQCRPNPSYEALAAREALTA